MESIKINTEFIKLEQLLKWAGAVDMGSDAKAEILAGKVKLNSVVELQRGKKVRPGDIVEYKGKNLKVEK